MDSNTSMASCAETHTAHKDRLTETAQVEGGLLRRACSLDSCT